MIRAFSLAACAGFASPALAWNAADAHYDPGEMAEARAELKSGHGGQIHALILGERLEYRSNEGDPLLILEGQGWVGGDLRKLWLKTEVEYETRERRVEKAEAQALYSRAITPFWDFQVGLRRDFRPDPSATYAVVGAQGLAPHWFEIDGQLFLSDGGDVSARLEAEYEFLLTQRLVLQPSIEIDVALSDDEDAGVGAGLSTAEAGLRLRYEVIREFAPYVGVSWERAFGDTRNFAEADGEDGERISWVTGIRLWF